ncbi:MAG: SDR family NAD(P)-dependent oxidoreductase [Mycobacterium sp.]
MPQWCSEPQRDPSGRCVVVVGAAVQAGWIIAEQIADRGASLVLADDDHGALTRLAQHLEDNFDTAVVTSQRDITSVAAVDHIAQQALTIFGRVDALVVVAPGDRSLVSGPGCVADESDHQIALIRRATLAVLPTMLAAGVGRVVYVVGGSADGSLEQSIDRAAARGAAHGVAVDLARQFASCEVTFNVVDLTPGELSGPQAHYAPTAAIVEFLVGDTSGFANGQIFGLATDICSRGSRNSAELTEFHRA